MILKENSYKLNLGLKVIVAVSDLSMQYARSDLNFAAHEIIIAMT